MAETMSGELTAAEVFLGDQNLVHGWTAATVTRLSKMCANSLLLFRIVQDLKERGYNEINLMAGNTPQLSMFVSGFNPQLVSYYRSKRICSVKTGLLYPIYQLYSL